MEAHKNDCIIKSSKDLLDGMSKDSGTYIIDLPEGFRIAELLAEGDGAGSDCKDFSGKYPFTMNKGNPDVFDAATTLSPCFTGYVGSCILESYARKVFEDGCNIVFMVSPDRNESLPLCMGLIDRLYYKTLPKRDEYDDELPSGVIEREPDDPVIIPCPFPIGYSVGKGKEKNIRWTCFYKFGRAGAVFADLLEKKIQTLENYELKSAQCASGHGDDNYQPPQLLLFLRESLHSGLLAPLEEYSDMYGKYLDEIIRNAFIESATDGSAPETGKSLQSRLKRIMSESLGMVCQDFKVPAPEMFSAVKAGTSFMDCRQHLKVNLYDDKKWPIGFALKLGAGTLTVAPDCHAAGFHEKTETDPGHEHSVTPPKSGGEATKYAIEVKEVIGDFRCMGKCRIEIAINKSQTHRVTAHQFLRFAGLWACSQKPYGGFVFYGGEDDFLRMDKSSERSAFPCLSIYRNDSNGEPAGFDADRNAALMKVLKNVPFSEIRSNVLALSSKRENSSIPRCLHNIELQISKETLDKLEKIEFAKTDSRAADYASTKKDFFSLLCNALNPSSE